MGGLALGQPSGGQGQAGAAEKSQRGLRDDALQMVPPCSIHGTGSTWARRRGRGDGGGGPVQECGRCHGGEKVLGSGVSSSGGGAGGLGGGSQQRLLRAGVTPAGTTLEEAAQVPIVE